MSELLLYTYIVINIVVLIMYYRRDYGVFQFPFLIACVSLTFVTPQLWNLLEFHYENMDLNLIMTSFCLCNIALFVGFAMGLKKGDNKDYIIEFKGGKYYTILLWVFFVVGVVATLMNRGVYKGGFISGVFVIVSFFASFINYALLMMLVGIKKNILTNKIYYILIAIIIILMIDKIVQSGRRAETINLVLTLSYFIMDKDERIYRYLRPIIPCFFFVGMIIGGEIQQYRDNSYSGDMTFSQNINSLDFSLNDESQTMVTGEVYNAVEGMHNVALYSKYDYGIFNWNGIVHTYVPTAIVGRDFKNSITFKSDTDNLKEYLTRSGSTMTGYYDAFASFGILGFIKFMIIGYIMGLLWSRRAKSQFSLLIYFPLLTPGLHLLTHSSNYFFSALFFIGVAIYPLLRPNLVREECYEIQ